MLFTEQVPVYIAEISPKHVRGTFTFTNQVIYLFYKYIRISIDTKNRNIEFLTHVTKLC